MQVIANRYRLDLQPNDTVFWRTQTYQARLAALEEIRQEYHGWKNDAEPGFQRVYSVIKRG